MKRTIYLAVAVVAVWVMCPLASYLASAQGHDAPHFSYSGDTGPGFWSEINPECGSPARQSPIDIDRFVTDRGLGPLNVTTKEATFRLSNTGYTVNATPTAESGELTITGKPFALAQFHFHTLSEHTVKGKRGVMELHAVFQNSPQNLAVIGLLYTIGQANPFLQRLLDAGLPPKTSSEPVTVRGVDVKAAFTSLASYYTYAGSLTTPPCSETVTWFVLKQWGEMSEEQYEAFRRILGNDFRPIQKTAGRRISATER
jgi:carbonic anhydrase